MSQYPSGPFGNKDPFGQQPSYQSPYQSPQGGYGYQQQPPQQSPPLSPLAMISLFSGLGSLGGLFFFCCCGPIVGLSFLMGVASVTTGHIALKKFQTEPGRESGKEIAIIGLVFGYIGLTISVLRIILLIVSMLVPAVLPAIAPNRRPQFHLEMPEPN
ncbi:DUF4190 domain-containing protein [Anatilimnocola floriformis]|uniref:DUF4190 domain-containing protein n=1 Tax=Anatilimnocola floriformis TaxID=2948575 RepID=UPI0020C31F9B|nr:DUF4190 domain-containing protein [Anatilimnocola floriformis]